MADTYDYVICGGGTAGCVIVARLSDETDLSILLVEAGAHNKDLENVHMVGGWSKNFETPEDWNIVSTPQHSADNHGLKLSRGRLLGGSSGVNGTLCIRSSKQDYDDWDLPGWSGEEVFASMRRAETFHNKDWFKPAPGAHGTDGPLHTEPFDLALISDLVIESYQDKGLPYHADMFTTGEAAHGCGHGVRTHYKGLRTTGADFVTNDHHQENIEILVNTIVDKVNLEPSHNGSHGLHATKVDLIGPDGTRQTVRARREIIVSGGAYCSPTILLRSGIGPQKHLEEHGIECKVDLAGVGQNLMDHPLVFAFYETEKEGLTGDYHVYHGDALASTYAKWKNEKSVFVTTFPFGAFAFARLDESLKDHRVSMVGFE